MTARRQWEGRKPQRRTFSLGLSAKLSFWEGGAVDRVLQSLTESHDWRLIALAATVCVVGLSTAFWLMNRAWTWGGARGRRPGRLAAVTAAASVWSTHCLVMQSYVAGLDEAVTYDLALTLTSFVLCIGAVALGIGASFLEDSRRMKAAGGTVGIVGVGVMHYVGLAGLRAPATLEWNPWVIALSVVVAVAISATAGYLYRRGAARRLAALALANAGAILVLHLLALSAVTLTPDAGRPYSPGLSPEIVNTLTLVAVIGIGWAVGLAAWMNHLSRTGALRQLREAVDAMPDGLAFYDSNDRLVLWNARYAEVNRELETQLSVGLSFRDILQIGLDEGRYDEAVGREAEWMAERLAERRKPSATLEQRVLGDRWLRVQDRRTAEGGVVTVCTDITDLKRDAAALVEARDAAQTANVAKSQFLANMSHEIRTPLNGVIGLTQALAKTELEAEQREMLDLIQSSGRSLQTLLSDILDLARVESGKLELTEDAFHLAGAVREAAQLYAENAREKHLDFNVDIDVDEAMWVRGDAVRLKQVLTNLISNAVKFTTRGFVSVTVQMGPERHGVPTLRFAVEDTGLGFDAATRARLFKRFEQADGGITRKFGGSGLGLSICRQLADMMGGDLDCESEPGGGSSFILTLPLNRCDAPEASASPVAAAVPVISRITKVLVADDHPTNRRVIELILAQAPVQIVIAENGAEAVEAFRRHDFDLVLMDMQMPVMDGLTATHEIRLHEAAMGAPRTPIVMLTANAMPEHIAAGRAAGADRHLAKPFNAAELLAMVADPAAVIQDQAQAA